LHFFFSPIFTNKSSANLDLVVEAPAVLRARTGVAEVLKATALLSNISSEQLVSVFQFLIDLALNDTNARLYDKFLEAGTTMLTALGGTHIAAMHPFIEKYLDASAPQSLKQGRARQSVVIFLGTLAQHLRPEDPRTMAIVEKLLDVLHTPSEAVQKSIAINLGSIVRNIPGSADKLIRRCIDLCLNGSDYGDRRCAKLPIQKQKFEKFASLCVRIGEILTFIYLFKVVEPMVWLVWSKD